MTEAQYSVKHTVTNNFKLNQILKILEKFYGMPWILET